MTERSTSSFDEPSAEAEALAAAAAAGAVGDAETTSPLPAPAKTETAAGRMRFRPPVQEGRRRRVVGVAAVGAAILIALGAVAALAAPNATSKVPEVRVTPGSAGDAPTIESYTSGAASAVCITPEGETQVPLNWKVDGASRIAIASAAKEVDAFERPLHDNLPARASAFLVSYPCKDASRAYTLMAQSPDGGRVSTVVIVSRTIATPKPTPTPTETRVPPRKPGGGQSGDSGTGENPGGSGGTDTGGGGTVDPGPAPEPTPPSGPEPTAQPTPEPTPEPTPDPTPEETPVPDPGDSSSTPAPTEVPAAP